MRLERFAGMNIELTDRWHSCDCRNPHHRDKNIIGICKICKDYIYNDENHKYITHTKCSHDKIMNNLKRYMIHKKYKPQKYRFI